MKSVIALCLVAALGSAHCGYIPASTLIRVPAHDSAIVKSDRVGGSFSYSTAEGHAYAAISPIVQHVHQTVAVPQVTLGHYQTPIAVSQPIYAQHQLLAQPIISHQHLISAPIAAAPIVTAPVVAAPIATAPIAAAPVLSTPVVSEPVAAAPAVSGTVVDADTVAVESA